MAAHVWSREGRSAREEGRAHQPPGRGYAVSKTKRPVGAISQTQTWWAHQGSNRARGCEAVRRPSARLRSDQTAGNCSHTSCSLWVIARYTQLLNSENRLRMWFLSPSPSTCEPQQASSPLPLLVRSPRTSAAYPFPSSWCTHTFILHSGALSPLGLPPCGPSCSAQTPLSLPDSKSPSI